MNNMVNWFEIYAADFDRAKKFYSEVFQCELTEMPVSSDNHAEMRYAVFPANEEGAGTAGALVKMDAVKPGAGGTLVYFASDDINTELDRVEAAGGKVLRSKFNVGEFGFIALVEDTEGNVIGLHATK